MLPNDGISNVSYKAASSGNRQKVGQSRTFWKTIHVTGMLDLNTQPNETKLRNLTIGVYQVRQAKSYLNTKLMWVNSKSL